MILQALILVLAANLVRSHEDMDVPLTQSIGGLTQSVQTQSKPGYPPGLNPGVRPIGGCPGLYPPTQGGLPPYGFPNQQPPGLYPPNQGGLAPYGFPNQQPPGLYPPNQGGLASYGSPNQQPPGLYPPNQGGLAPYGFPNQPLIGGEVIVPVNPQYQSPFNPPPGPPIYYNGQTFVPNVQSIPNTQHTGSSYYIPPCSKPLLEAGVGDKNRAANNDVPQSTFRIAEEQDTPPTENILGGLYLAPYKPCDNNSGRSSEDEDIIPVQLYDTRSADSPILTAVPVHPHFAQGLNNYFHRFGYTRPLPHGGLIYSNTFSNHLHSNLH